MKNFYFTLVLLFLFSSTFAQNEFVNDGGTVTVQSGALLYVKGQMITTSTNGGAITNNGLIQINTNNSNAGGGVWRWDLPTPMTGNGKVLFEGGGNGEIKSNVANPDIRFATLEIDVEDISGNPPLNFAYVTVSKSFKADSLRLMDGRLVVSGSNEVHITNTRANAIQGNFGTNQSNYVQGRLRRNIEPATARLYKFPVGSDPVNGEGFNLAEIDVSSAPGGSLVGQFIDYTTAPTFNFFQALTTCTHSPYNSPVWNQWIELSEMVPNYGLWRFEPTNGTGWSYNFIGTPNSLKISDNFGSYRNIKIIKAPTNYSFSNDWSTLVTSSGDLCDGVNVDGNRLRDYNNNLVSNVYARGLNSFSDFGFGGGGSSGLPVELITLRADPIENKYIKVSWATATEVNNAGFEVLKSEDAINFTNIGWVPGAGNSTVQNNYFYDDHEVVPNKLYYYRLRQVDFNGHSELTYIVSAMITSEHVFVISDFMPNPANNTTSLVITSSDQRDVNVIFYNTLGQLISSSKLLIEKGNNRFNFDLSGFAAGTYHSQIIAGEYTVNKKIIVTR
jgi:hypothetical protein